MCAAALELDTARLSQCRSRAICSGVEIAQWLEPREHATLGRLIILRVVILEGWIERLELRRPVPLGASASQARHRPLL